MKKTKENNLFALTQKYFQDYLPKQRGLSPNSIIAYRDAMKMLLEFTAGHLEKKAANLKLADFTVEIVFKFLDNLEKERNNNVITRNLRLAAIRTFFNFLISEVPESSGEFQRIIKIPMKQAAKKRIDYLEVDEVQAILNGINRSARLGGRDYLLFQFLYNTGARVQEVCDVRVKDIVWSPNPSVILTGKGNKSRQTPLWPTTVELLKKHLKDRKITDTPDAPIFVNQQGEKLTRYGIGFLIKSRIKSGMQKCPSLSKKKISSHTFRHTTAMHLLQAGVALNIIQAWLGHVDVSTTNQYVEIDMEMKRKALGKINSAVDSKDLQAVIEKNRDVISWLGALKG